jgi:hypothetical protein
VVRMYFRNLEIDKGVANVSSISLMESLFPVMYVFYRSTCIIGLIVNLLKVQ